MASSPVAPASDIGGIYLLVPEGYKLDKMGRALGVRGIKGVSYAFPWDQLEPKQGQYRWTPLVNDLKQMARKNKRIMLGLASGLTTPEWVYKNGARRFEFVDKNPYHGDAYYPKGHRYNSYMETLKIPVPWDEPFLAAWEKSVAALGKELAAQQIELAMVIVSGPNRHSFEMHLPREPEDKARWRALGYKPEKLLEAWKRSIDAFAEAFPETPLILHLSPVIFRDGVLEAVAKYGYQTYGDRFFMQNDVLVPSNKNMKRPDWAVLEKYKGRTTIGFQRGLPRIKGWQSLPRSEKLRLREKNFKEMFAKGTRLGAYYFEVGAPDVKAFPHVVDEAATQLDEQIKLQR